MPFCVNLMEMGLDWHRSAEGGAAPHTWGRGDEAKPPWIPQDPRARRGKDPQGSPTAAPAPAQAAPRVTPCAWQRSPNASRAVPGRGCARTPGTLSRCLPPLTRPAPVTDRPGHAPPGPPRDAASGGGGARTCDVIGPGRAAEGEGAAGPVRSELRVRPRSRVPAPAEMTLAVFFGCTFIAFGPAFGLFIFTIARDPLRIIILIAGSVRDGGSAAAVPRHRDRPRESGAGVAGRWDRRLCCCRSDGAGGTDSAAGAGAGWGAMGAGPGATAPALPR